MNLNNYSLYTVQDILNACGINMEEVKDYRRVQIGGLGFDYLDQKVRAVGDELVVTLDGEPHTTFTVTQPQQEQ